MYLKIYQNFNNQVNVSQIGEPSFYEKNSEDGMIIGLNHFKDIQFN